MHISLFLLGWWRQRRTQRQQFVFVFVFVFVMITVTSRKRGPCHAGLMLLHLVLLSDDTGLLIPRFSFMHALDTKVHMQLIRLLMKGASKK